MRIDRIHIRARHVGLDHVTSLRVAGVCMAYRIDKIEQRACLVALALHRVGKDRPDRAMRVLATIFANPGRIGCDVAGVLFRMIERRGEQQRHPIILADQVLFHGLHRLGGMRRIIGAGDDAP